MISTDQIEAASRSRRPRDRIRRRRSSRGNRTTAISREPALSATITRKLGRVVPANLQIDARWDAIRDAREAAKKSDGKNAPSPSVMIAWAVVRAMEKHAPFRSLMLEDDRIRREREFRSRRRGRAGRRPAGDRRRHGSEQARLAGLCAGATTRRSRQLAADESTR